MMLSADTLDDLMREAFGALKRDGTTVDPPPSRGPCAELTAVTLQLTNPLARTSRSGTRGKIFSALGELCWYLSGSGRTEDITPYIPEYVNADEDGVIHGAYGPRLRNFDGVDQLEEVIRLLKDKPSSRRAVIQLYDHEDLNNNHLDVPCTCVLQFLGRSGYLHAVVFMRSNDAYLGLPHDIFTFTMIQEIVARSLGLQLGTYTHMVGSLHLYEEDRAKAIDFLDEGFMSTLRPMPSMPQLAGVGDFDQLLEIERAVRQGQAYPLPSDTYFRDLALMLTAHNARRDPARLQELMPHLSDAGYRMYVQQLIDRASS